MRGHTVAFVPGVVAVLACGGVSVDPRGVPDGVDAGRGGASAGGASGVTDAGDGLDPPDGPRSGSRLEVRGWVHGGSSTPSGVVWDSERGVECAPATDLDGSQRCLPTDSGFSVAFTDPECKDPVVVGTQALGSCGVEAPVPRYVSRAALLRCRERDVTVYSVLGRVEAPAQLYAASGLGCTATDVPDQRFYEAVESPPGDWVRFERELTAVTSRLGVVYWTGEDGSRLFDGLRLLPEDTACDEQEVAEGSWRCLPSASARTGRGYFVDGACTEPVAAWFDCGAPQVVRVPGAGTDIPTDDCSSFSAPDPLFEAVKVESGVHSSQGAAGGCEASGLGFDYYRAGAPLPVERYPIITEAHVGNGRLQSILVESGGRGLFTRAGRLFDTVDGRPCRAVEIGGRTFCVPDGGLGATRGFADPLCTVPVTVVGRCDAVPRAVTDMPAVLCPASLVAVGPRHVGGALYERGPSGDCAEYPASDGATLYELGDAVEPASVFAAFDAGKL